MTATQFDRAIPAATLSLAAGAWYAAVQQMRGMDGGVGTELGSFSFFVAAWVAMMAAMMLPGAVPALVRRTRDEPRLVAAPLFAGSYLAVWMLVGLAVYAVYRPHGTSLAGALIVGAGLYELTPLKRTSRRRCRERVRSGLPRGVVDVPVALAIVALGLVVAADPSAVPGLMQTM